MHRKRTDDNSNGPAEPDMFNVLGMVDIPQIFLCSSWRLLLVYFTTLALNMAMIGTLLYVGLESAFYFLVCQLRVGVILAICSFFYIPLDDSAKETQAGSLQREMASMQDLIGNFICVTIAMWIFMWSLCDWRGEYWLLLLFGDRAYIAFSLAVISFLVLQVLEVNHCVPTPPPIVLGLICSRRTRSSTITQVTTLTRSLTANV